VGIQANAIPYIYTDYLALPNGFGNADRHAIPNSLGDADRYALSKGGPFVFSRSLCYR
jgi:hypothetical protein